MINPWDVESPEDFLYYCCPECETKCQGLNDFKNHALQDHPRAHSLFFEDRNVARAAAEKLIAIQQNSSSPSVGHSALLEALSSAEADRDLERTFPSRTDREKRLKLVEENDDEELDFDHDPLVDLTNDVEVEDEEIEVYTQCLFIKKVHSLTRVAQIIF